MKPREMLKARRLKKARKLRKTTLKSDKYGDAVFHNFSWDLCRARRKAKVFEKLFSLVGHEPLGEDFARVLDEHAFDMYLE